LGDEVVAGHVTGVETPPPGSRRGAVVIGAAVASVVAVGDIVFAALTPER
jgi:hypothetical protein